ncbi:MAG: DUF2339 domain-containing protein [Acidimicrobiales bacterium]
MGSESSTDEQVVDLLNRLDALDRQMHERLQTHERRIAALEDSRTPLSHAPIGMPPPPPPGAIPLPGPGLRAAPRGRPDPPSPRQTPTYLEWEVLIRWAGIALVALAAIFLVSTSISRGWIGPNLQLAAATLGGLGLLGGAIYFAPELRAWAVTLGIGGSVVLPVCAAAAHAWLDLVSEDVALILIISATVVSVSVAFFTRLDEVSIVALLGGMCVPASFGFFEVDPITLTAWWTAAHGALAATLGWFRKSTLLRLAGVVAAATGLLFASGVSADQGADVLNQGLGPLILIAAVMWLGPTVAERIGDHNWASFDHWSVAVVPGFAWTAVLALRSRGEEAAWFDAGVVGLLMTSGFLMVLVGTFRSLPKTVSLAHFLGAGAVLTASLIAMFEGPVLVIALAAQAVFTFIIGQIFDDEPISIAAALLGVGALALTGFGIFDGMANDGATPGEALAHLLVILLLGCIAMFFGATGPRELATALGITAWVGAMGWLASVLINLPQGQAAISLGWAAMAASAIVSGIALRSPVVRTTGLVTLTVVVGKLLTVDLSEVEVFWRVGVFFVVGSGLLRLAYVLPRYQPDGVTHA